MALVDYASTSSSDEDEDYHTGAKQARKQRTSQTELPVLPPELSDLYQVEPRKGDDPAFHQGRVRSSQHIAGEWPTHVYFDFWPSRALQKVFEDVIKNANGLERPFTSLLTSQYGVERELHVSLSQSIMLHTHQKEQFRVQLSQIAAQSVTISFEQFEMMSNDEQTRQFLVAKVSKSAIEALQPLRQSLDTIMDSYGLPSLYDVRQIYSDLRRMRLTKQNAQYHASIAWRDFIEDDASSEFLERMNAMHQLELASIKLSVTGFKVKIGKDITLVAMN